MFAVIMAGGGGTRLWPKSRDHHPKQMHALVSPQPLVQESTEALQEIVGPKNVFVITNSHHAKMIMDLMPEVANRIFIDPYRRDTAPAIGLAAIYLSAIDQNAVFGVFPADHYIRDRKKFAEVVHAAGKLAEAGHVATIGIKPSGPETGYGYIETEGLAEKVDKLKAYKVRRFVEKPDRSTAEKYCDAGNYFWNSGMFVWSVPTILGLFAKHLPDTMERLNRIKSAIGTADEERVLHEEYKGMERISIDYGIMEKLEDILVIPGDFGWNDIGSWATVAELSPKDAQGNAIQATHVSVDTKNCLVLGSEGKIVATVGIEDLIVIDTPDALLICRKDRAQDVKKIVDKLRAANLDKFL
jgi:mannose-1-phosphate guanylyltransferase